jgi:hypothetical protein
LKLFQIIWDKKFVFSEYTPNLFYKALSKAYKLSFFMQEYPNPIANIFILFFLPLEIEISQGSAAIVIASATINLSRIADDPAPQLFA